MPIFRQTIIEELAADHGSKCRICGRAIEACWNYCDSCRLALAVEDRHEAIEELAWHVELAERKRG